MAAVYFFCKRTANAFIKLQNERGKGKGEKTQSGLGTTQHINLKVVATFIDLSQRMRLIRNNQSELISVVRSQRRVRQTHYQYDVSRATFTSGRFPRLRSRGTNFNLP